jgi:hypothetical protein
MKKILICLALVGLCASLAVAQKGTPSLAPIGQKVVPLTYQAIGADLKPFGPVYPYTEGGVAQTDVLAFDCFSPDRDGFPTDGLYGTTFGMGSNRWYLGTTYDNPHHAFDIHLSPGTEGQMATGMEFAWFDSRPTNTGEQFYVLTWPIEDYDASCSGPAFSSTYDGIEFWFGSVCPETYGWTTISGIALPYQLPRDGVGGNVVIFAQAVTDSEIVLSSPYHQPMLWGTFDPNCTPPGNNTSFQVATQYDDNNPLDGTFQPGPPPGGECYQYHYGVCPDPLGAMWAFWVSGPPQSYCDANCDGCFDGFDVAPFFFLLQDHDAWRQMYGCDPIIAGDANCDNYVDGFDIDPFFRGLVVGYCDCP